jgi:hypothetical protein
LSVMIVSPTEARMIANGDCKKWSFIDPVAVESTKNDPSKVKKINYFFTS